MGKVSSNHGKHPYLRESFWEDPNNQFWERSDIFNKEKYRKQFKILHYEKDGPTKDPGRSTEGSSQG